MNFIDSTYFKGQILIDFGADSDMATEMLNDFTIIETNILVDALGYDLYKQFTDGLAEVTPAQKWLDLRDGADFTVVDEQGRTVTVKWNGIINSEKISFLSYFIYYYYVTNQITSNTITGEVLSLNENSSIFFNNYKLTSSWNMGMDLYGVDIDLITGNNAILRGNRYYDNAYLNATSKGYLPRINYYQEILKGTLYNFIYFTNDATPNTYTNWNFKEQDKINIYGI